jgi:hypothetical protein
LSFAWSPATAALLAAALVASCEPTSDAAPVSTRNPATAADVSVERVVLQAYRAIGDRHLNEPDFRRMAQETYRGFASADPALSLQAADRSFTLLREGHQVVSRPTPADPTDGRAWGGMLAELFAASIDASPVLQQTERSTLIKGAMVATTKQLDRNSRYADPTRPRTTASSATAAAASASPSKRTDDKAHPDPRRAGRLAVGQGRRAGRRPDRRGRWRLDDRQDAGRRRAQAARQRRPAGHPDRAARQAAARSPSRCGAAASSRPR